jgi:hypothetical protein
VILGRRVASALLFVSASGLEAGDFRVDSTPSTQFAGPSVAKSLAGDFFVAWQNAGGIRARRYGTDGLPLSADFPVNEPVAGPEYRDASVARFPSGSHVVAWSTIENTFPLGSRILPSMFVCHV